MMKNQHFENLFKHLKPVLVNLQKLKCIVDYQKKLEPSIFLKYGCQWFKGSFKSFGIEDNKKQWT